MITMLTENALMHNTTDFEDMSCEMIYGQVPPENRFSGRAA
jgi:hypothetical protein